MRIQRVLDEDLVMRVDDCIALPASERDTARSMRLSLRCGGAIKPREGNPNALFGIARAE